MRESQELCSAFWLARKAKLLSKVVFVLGAGASAHTGAPLMANFLDVARLKFSRNPSDQYAPDLKRVFDAISSLQSVHSKSELDLINLESVFSAFEMATLLDRPPGSPELNQSMRRLIEWTLNESIDFQVNSLGLQPHNGYQHFAQVVKDIGQCCVITFNYDIALDFAMAKNNICPTYAIEEAENASVSLLKLHGSVNWAQCPQCERVSVKDVSSRIGTFTVPPRRHEGLAKWGMLSGSLKCCGNQLSDSFIIPPTWDKAMHRNTLARVWRRAARELSKATDIIVCGYSLPETAHFFTTCTRLGR